MSSVMAMYASKNKDVVGLDAIRATNEFNDETKSLGELTYTIPSLI